MNFDNKKPIYMQIMDFIKIQAVSGRLKPGDKLQSVREYSKELKVNPNTIQRSYQELEREGLVYTQRGMGTFLTEDIENISSLKYSLSKDIVLSFIDDMKNIGFNREEIERLVEEIIREERKNEHSGN